MIARALRSIPLLLALLVPATSSSAPAVTYLGGSGAEAYPLALVQPLGAASVPKVFVAGRTDSPVLGREGLPLLENARTFVARLSADLAVLEEVQIFGDGSLPLFMGFQPDGHLVVAGTAFAEVFASSLPVRPATVGTPGFRDHYAVRIDPETLAIEGAVLLCGAFDTDQVTSMAIHPTTGEVFLAGSGNSPGLAGIGSEGRAPPFQGAPAGALDAFVLRLPASVSDVASGTFLGGGSGSETDVQVGIGPASTLIVTGLTSSWTPLPFPTTEGAHQRSHGGGTTDIFVALLPEDLGSLQAATYVGGEHDEALGTSLGTFDPAEGAIFIAGSWSMRAPPWARESYVGWLNAYRQDLVEPLGAFQKTAVSTCGAGRLLRASSERFFVAVGAATDCLDEAKTEGMLQRSRVKDAQGIGNDAALLRLAWGTSGFTLERATYLGGSGDDGATWALAPDGKLYGAGRTTSVDLPLTAGGAFPANAGLRDAFVAWVNADLTAGQATYLGGSLDESASLALSSYGGTTYAYAFGITPSPDLPANGFQTALVSAPDAFVARFEGSLLGEARPRIGVADSADPPGDRQVDYGRAPVGAGATQTVTVTNLGTGTLGIGNVATADALAPPYAIASDGCSGHGLAAREACSIVVRFTPPDARLQPYAESFDIPSDDPAEPVVTVSLRGRGNNAPSAPALLSPAAGASGLGGSVTFRWTASADADGDPLTYDLHVCADPTFAACPAPVNGTPISGLRLAALGGWGLLLAGAGAALLRRRWAAGLVALALAAGAALASCGGGGGGGPAPGPGQEVSYAHQGLAPATTYYWKVVATDGAARVESPARSCSTL